MSSSIIDVSNQPEVKGSDEETPEDAEDRALLEVAAEARKRSAAEAEVAADEPPGKRRTPDHTNLVASHYNALEEKGLQERNQSRIVHMRNFNNWVKSMLINEYVTKVKDGKSHGSALRVLDMCCGKGGDLLKWRKGGISHLICADIADVSVEQCQARYRDMAQKRYPPLFSAEFLACDCTKVRLRERYKDPSLQLDLVSCQFAFHYSFESQAQAECMMRNASESLRPGGYFIGTLPDARELVSRWRAAGDKRFGNDIYSVEFVSEEQNGQPALFGAKYDFHLEGVVDCPEFLVYPPLFRKLAAKYGLELVTFERFADFYERMKPEDRGLLSRMQALQTYPPQQREQPEPQPEEYSHAREHLQATKSQRIGTLSKSEWEATTIYSVFAFQKNKTVWNAEGKPEYVKC